MAEIADLQVQLQLQAEQFKRGVAQANNSLDRMERNTKQTNRSMQTMQKTMGGLRKRMIQMAAAAASYFTVQQLRAAVEYGDSIAKTADKIGLTTESLQELRFAAGEAGVAQNTLDMAIQRFARRSGEARGGAGELVKTYKQLGIELNNADGSFKTTEALLREYADALQKVEDPQERLRLAFKGFDSEGAALVNMLKNGSAGLDEMADKARTLGVVMEDGAVRKAEVLNDKINRLTLSIGTQFKSALVNGTSALLEFFDVFTEEGRARARLKQLQASLEQVQARIDGGSLSGRNLRSSQMTASRLRNEIKDVEDQITELVKYSEAAASASANALGGSGGSGAAQTMEEFAESIRRAVDPTIKFQEELGKLNDALNAGAISPDTYRAAVIRLQEATFKTSTGAKDTAKSIEELALEIQKSVDPSIEFFEQMDILNRVFQAGAIDADVYRAKVLALQEVFDNSTGIADQKSMWEELGESINFTIDLNKSFGDNMKSIASSVISELLRIIATQKLLNLMMGSFGGGGGGGGGGSFAKGGAFNMGNVVPFAHGGVFDGGRSGIPFPMSGGRTGIFAEKGPEAIMPLSRDASGSLGVKMNVNVTNNASGVAAVEVEKSDRNGEINIIINRVAQDIIRGGGKVSGALERTYNVRR